MVDFQRENRRLLSKLDELNDENVILIRRITNLSTSNRSCDVDTDTSSLTSFSNDVSTSSNHETGETMILTKIKGIKF